tara:strand:+ start:4674 stop:5093 length:420 start_codon:yes stop_codon:yes gene_type:complete
MGIETRYDYIYYTVLTQDWFDEAERVLNNELTTEILVEVMERKLKRSKDWTLNNFKVDYSQHSQDIEFWIHRNLQHKECPVFVQIENNQPIVRTGSGTLFVFYQKQEDDNVEDHYGTSDCPDGLYYGSVDGLAGAGGRL